MSRWNDWVQRSQHCSRLSYQACKSDATCHVKGNGKCIASRVKSVQNGEVHQFGMTGDQIDLLRSWKPLENTVRSPRIERIKYVVDVRDGVNELSVYIQSMLLAPQELVWKGRVKDVRKLRRVFPFLAEFFSHVHNPWDLMRDSYTRNVHRQRIMRRVGGKLRDDIDQDPETWRPPPHFPPYALGGYGYEKTAKRFQAMAQPEAQSEEKKSYSGSHYHHHNNSEQAVREYLKQNGIQQAFYSRGMTMEDAKRMISTLELEPHTDRLFLNEAIRRKTEAIARMGLDLKPHTASKNKKRKSRK